MSKQAQNGDALLKFKHLFKELAPSLIFYAMKYVDPSTAEDIVQEVFINVWKKRNRLTLDDSLKAYLFRSIQYACLDYLKHQKVVNNFKQFTIDQLRIEEIFYSGPQEAYNYDQRLEKIYVELEKLPPKCREIFELHYLKGLKADSIAKELNISKRTVEAQLYKALKKMRDALLIFYIFFLIA